MDANSLCLSVTAWLQFLQQSKFKNMNSLEFLILFAVCSLLSFVAGYILGNAKATTRAEEMRRWWRERERRNGQC